MKASMSIGTKVYDSVNGDEKYKFTDLRIWEVANLRIC